MQCNHIKLDPKIVRQESQTCSIVLYNLLRNAGCIRAGLSAKIYPIICRPRIANKKSYSAKQLHGSDFD